MSGNRLLVLAWHNVESTHFFPSAPGAGSRGLEAQLRLIRRIARPVRLDRALRDLSAERPLPRRAVAITFDDGYRDNLDVAAPLLSRLGLPATFFLVPGLMSREVKAWWEEVAWAFESSALSSLEWEGRTWTWDSSATRSRCCNLIVETLKRRSRRDRDAAVEEIVSTLDPQGRQPSDLFFDWDGARSLARLGFGIGSHTVTHPILSEETPEVQRSELSDSRRSLQAEIGVTVDLLAYPNGTELDYNEDSMAAARASGYSHSVTVLEGWNTPRTPEHEIRRFIVYPERGTRGLSIVLRTTLERLATPLRAAARSS